MKIIGVTGGIGSGKSTFATLIPNAFIINADNVYNDLLQNDIEIVQAIKNIFQELHDNFNNNFIDKQKLAKIVLNNPKKLKMLTDITHPFIDKKVIQIVKGLPKNTVCVYDAFDLTTSCINFDFKIGIICDIDLRINRIVSRDNKTSKQAQNWILAGKNDDFYRLNCDVIIENNGDLNQLENAAKNYEKLL